jgi:hypothetical protein
LDGPGRAEGFVASPREAGGRMPGPFRVKPMMTLLKIAAAALITIGVLNPSFTPKADHANCNCHANS